MNLDTIQKIIDLTSFIKDLISLYKERDTYITSLNIFMDSITQSMITFQKSLNQQKKNEKLPLAFDLLYKTLSNFHAFLEKENKSNKIMKFLKGTKLRSSCQQYMDEIQIQLASLNLAVNINYGSEGISRFDDLVKRLENIDEKLVKVAIKKGFQNPLAADFWIQNFGEETTVDSMRFMEKFKQMVLNVEKTELTENQSLNILALMDEDQSKTVNFQEWDKFYNEIWSYYERKEEVFSKKSLFIQSDDNIKLQDLILIYEETHPDIKKEYDYPLKHIFKINDESYEFMDISHKIIKNKKDLTKEGLIIGKKKVNINPDIYFDTHLKTISGKQFQITAKKYLNVKGFYINDLSTTNVTSFKVEDKPYAINNNMLIDLNGHIFEVIKVVPEPTDENNKGYYFVPTSGMENSGESLIEETIKLVRKKRNTAAVNDLKEETKNEENDENCEKTEKTLKRRPKVNYAVNKQIKPSITLKCIEGLFKDKKYEIKTEGDKLFIAGVGSAKDNAICLEDEEGILDYNCQIVYSPEYGCWVIAEKWPKYKQTQYSAGTLIYLRTADDYKKDQAASFACKLRNGMKIFFNCHILSVNYKE